ncbi:MAG: exodeoxyribonuclease VII large subunit, partial [Leptospiraceae bacterium]|nr:exodeoxyribonuclease VII large subunit [Leptospiraceae bacterium]
DVLNLIMQRNLEKHKKRHDILMGRIENFSPLGTLKRGFSVVRNKKKKVIQSPDDVKKGEELDIILEKGNLKVEVL